MDLETVPGFQHTVFQCQAQPIHQLQPQLQHLQVAQQVTVQMDSETVLNHQFQSFADQDILVMEMEIVSQILQAL